MVTPVVTLGHVNNINKRHPIGVVGCQHLLIWDGFEAGAILARVVGRREMTAQGGQQFGALMCYMHPLKEGTCGTPRCLLCFQISWEEERSAAEMLVFGRIVSCCRG